MNLSAQSAARYTKVLTSLALLRSTYARFVGGLSVEEALEWPQFGEWLQERAAELRREDAG
jgi:hypothetical protein